MYRTRLFLLKYYLPVLLLGGLGLALWQIDIPWYVPVVLLPFGIVVVVVVVGSVALAVENRAVPANAESFIRPIRAAIQEALVQIPQSTQSSVPFDPLGTSGAILGHTMWTREARSEPLGRHESLRAALEHAEWVMSSPDQDARQPIASTLQEVTRLIDLLPDAERGRFRKLKRLIDDYPGDRSVPGAM